MVHEAKVVGHRHPGIHSNVWVKFLSDKQIKQGIRRVLRTSSTLDREYNQRLNLLLTEAKQREGLKAWLRRVLELLEANLAEDAKHVAEGANIMAPGQHSRASS